MHARRRSAKQAATGSIKGGGLLPAEQEVIAAFVSKGAPTDHSHHASYCCTYPFWVLSPAQVVISFFSVCFFSLVTLRLS